MADPRGEFFGGAFVRYDFKPTGPRWYRLLWSWWRRRIRRCCHNEVGLVVLNDGWRSWQCGACRALTADPRPPLPWEESP